MIYNLLGTVVRRRPPVLYSQIYRHLSGAKEHSQNILHPKATAANEVDEALEIEANLFDQSSLQYAPVSAEEVLRRNKLRPRKKPTETVAATKLPPAVPKMSRSERKQLSQTINDSELGLEFVKLHLKDPRLNELLIVARSRKRRDKDGQIIIEGRRLVLEALKCGLRLLTVIFSQKDELAELKAEMRKAQSTMQTKFYKVPQHDLKLWSTLTTPPGLMAIFERPAEEFVEKMSERRPAMPITVICDNIREPNNLGSIIRSCAAIPCQQVVVTKGCCDPWESKALRGGCGGQFFVPIKDDVDWQDVPLTIPPEAADNCCVFIAENKVGKQTNKCETIDYAAVDYIGSHNVVVIGGESHGVSEEAYRFLKTVGDRGKCLHIPLADGVDSLNVTSALTLILYELRKVIQKSIQGHTN